MILLVDLVYPMLLVVEVINEDRIKNSDQFSKFNY